MAETFHLPAYVVCPRCHGPLTPVADGVVCAACDAFYPRRAALHFAATVGDPEKARQQAIYDGAAGFPVPYADEAGYRAFCELIDGLVRRRGLTGFQFKALKTRQLLDRLSPREGELVLDIGSGDGSALALLETRYGVRGVGVDISPLAVERAALLAPWGREYYQGDAEQLPFADGTFDGLVCLDVLEHLPHPDRCIAEAGRVLRDGGWALFYAVSRRDDYTWHWEQRRLSGGVLGVDDGAGHRRENFIRPQQARRWAAEAGMQVRLVPFHGLATLALDERFVALFGGLLRLPGAPETLLRLAEWADRPLTARGFGNGFYVVVRR